MLISTAVYGITWWLSIRLAPVPADGLPRAAAANTSVHRITLLVAGLREHE